MLAKEIILFVILLICLISQCVKGVLTSVCEFLKPHGYEWQTLNDAYLFAKPALTWVWLHTFHHFHLWHSCLWQLNIIRPWNMAPSPSTMGWGIHLVGEFFLTLDVSFYVVGAYLVYLLVLRLTRKELFWLKSLERINEISLAHLFPCFLLGPTFWQGTEVLLCFSTLNSYSGPLLPALRWVGSLSFLPHFKAAMIGEISPPH